MSKFVSSCWTYRAWVAHWRHSPQIRSRRTTMNVSMEAPRTPQHDLVAMTAALRGALMQRVEQGIHTSGLTSYYMYLVAKRLMFAGPLATALISEQLRQNPQIIEENLHQMAGQGLVAQEHDVWQITEA